MKYALITGFSLTILRLLFIQSIPLTGDEAYYWQWARHLDLGYYEQGPVLAVIIWLFTFFGRLNTEFTVRLGAVVLSSSTMLIMYLTYLRLFGKDSHKGAFLSVLFINSSMIFSIGSVLMMHDTVMIFFISLFFLNLIYLRDDQSSYIRWMISGILLGLATMSKYTAGAAYIASVIYFLTQDRQKHTLRGLILMTFTYALTCTPVFYWNFIHDMASFKYLLIRSGSKKTFFLAYFFELILSQAALFSIFLLSPAISGFKRAFSGKKDPSYMFAFISLFMLIPFIMLSLKSKVEANWPAFALYPVFFIAARAAETKEIRITPSVMKYAIPGLILVVLVHLQFAFSIIKLPARMDPSEKFRGYKEVAVKASEVYNDTALKGRVFIAARHYQTASLLSFYMEKQPMVYCILKHESSKNYRFWTDYRKFRDTYCIFFYSEGWEQQEASALFNETVSCSQIKADRAFNYCIFKGYKGEQ